MIRNKVKISQLALILLLIIPGGKYLTLPAILAQDVGRDSWIVYGLLFLADFICLLFILWAIKLNKSGNSFYKIISSTLSPVTAKIIFVVFALLYSMRVTLLAYNSMDLFGSTFSVDTNWIAYVLPICAIIVYALYKGATTIARVSQMIFVAVFLSLLIILGFSAFQADFGNLQPVLEKGIAPVVKSCFSHTFWFADSMMLLFFMDYIPKEEKKTYPIIVAFALGAIVSVGLNMVFISLFDNLAPYNNTAMSKLSQFFIQVTANGRMDWLTLSIWLLSIFIKSIILCFCSYRCWAFVFNLCQIKFCILPTVLTLIPVVVLPLFIFSDKTVSAFNQAIAGQIVLATVQYLLPLLMPLLTYFADKKTAQSSPTADRMLKKRYLIKRVKRSENESD